MDGLLVLTLPKPDYARRHVVKINVGELAGEPERKSLDVSSETDTTND